MTSEFIEYESVHDFDYFLISEDLFRKKYENHLIVYKKEIESLKEEFRLYLNHTTKISQSKVKAAENCLVSNKKVLVELKKEQEHFKQDIERTSRDNSKISETIDQLHERLQELEQKDAHLAELKNNFYNEVKKVYSALILAKDYYKDKLKMYFTIEAGSLEAKEISVLIKFFTSKKDSNSRYSLTIVRDTHTKKVKLADMAPKLEIFNQLNNRLQETGDIPGFLCCVRKCFIIDSGKHNS